MNEFVFLDSVLSNVYLKAFDRNTQFDYPVRVIDDPQGVQYVLKNHQKFIKNYYFLEALSVGRLSANGDDWRMRAPLTQPLIARYEERANEEVIREIYSRHLMHFFNSQSSGSLYQAFINSAMEVIFLVFDLPASTPWPIEILNQIRKLLNQQQALGMGYGSPDQFMANSAKLHTLLHEIEDAWRGDPKMNSFLNSLKEQSTSPLFDPVGELVQVFQAASETTASSLMWFIYCLLKYPSERKKLQLGVERSKELFIKEVLRLFPPLPFISRISLQDDEIEGESIKRGDVLLVSLVGLHCHPDYWGSPSEFNSERAEFLNNTFDKAAYIPFLSGPRTCGGMRLANSELNSALKEILEICEFLDFAEPPKMSYGVMSRPANNLENYLKIRKP